MTKLKSRKFWVACAMMIATVIAGIGYEVDPKIWATLFGAEGVAYIIIEGIIDAVSAR